MPASHHVGVQGPLLDDTTGVTLLLGFVLVDTTARLAAAVAAVAGPEVLVHEDLR